MHFPNGNEDRPDNSDSAKRAPGSVSGILLAGGAARRMGGLNKALLKVGGRTIVERVADTLASIFSEVLIVTNSPNEFAFLGLPIFTDLRRGHAALGGLYTGLTVCSSDYGFLVACDMPFLAPEAIVAMTGLVGDHEVVIPRIGGRYEPLYAAYSRNCLPHIEDMLNRRDLQIINLFPKVTVREVEEEYLRRFDPRLLFTININTPDDLIRAQDIARELDQDSRSDA